LEQLGQWGEEKILVINVYWTGKSADEESFADQVAKLILERDSKVKDHDLLRVTIIRGYDIGIAHAQVHILTAQLLRSGMLVCLDLRQPRCSSRQTLTMSAFKRTAWGP